MSHGKQLLPKQTMQLFFNDDYANDREVLFLRFPQRGCGFVGTLETEDPQKESAGWHLSASHHPHSDTRFPVF